MVRLLMCSTLLFFTNASAQDFQFEGELVYADGDARELESETLGLSATWYLRSVPTRDVPLAEAAFFAQRSSVGVAFQQDETTLTLPPILITPPPVLIGPLMPIDQPLSDVDLVVGAIRDRSDINRYQLNGRYVHEPTGWLVEAGIALVDGDGFASSDTEGDTFLISVGRYVTESTTVTLFAGRDSLESEQSSTIPCTLTLIPCAELTSRFETDTQTDSYGVAARHVANLGRRYLAVSGFLEYSDLETDIYSSLVFDGDIFGAPQPLQVNQTVSGIWRGGADLTWYITQRLGLGASFSRTHSDVADENQYAGLVRWFVHPRVELKAQYLRTDVELSGGDVDLWQLVVAGRI